MATQGERRAETRQRLLDAAADLFATRGIEASSVDAIAEAAERTSGAIYDHFGGKEGILFALLEGWVDDVAAVITAELVAADHPRRPPGRAVAQHHPAARPATTAGSGSSTSSGRTPPATSAPAQHLARRYAAAWESVDAPSPSGPTTRAVRRRPTAPAPR